jgi:hypothetical protein
MSTAITVENIKQAIEKVPVEKLETLYNFVRSLTEIKPNKLSREEFLRKMDRVKIDAPADFATNIDDYLYGAKSITDDIR